jgi:hypothetical protein
MTINTRSRTGCAGWTALLAIVLSTTGCLQPSLNPLVLPEDAVFSEGLLGAWVCPGETWTFTRTSDADRESHAVYDVSIRTQATTSDLFAWLGRVDDALFVTFMLKSDGPIAHRFTARHLIPSYTFGRLTIEADRVQLAMLDAGWIDQAEAAGLLTIGVRRQEPRSDVLLIAGPAELQQFARTYAGDAQVFGTRVEFVRPATPGSGSDSTARPTGTCYSEQ